MKESRRHIIEQELIDLGFKKVSVTAEESGCELDWYYYSYDFKNVGFSLISNSKTESDEDSWIVETFEDENIIFTNQSDLKLLINLINKNIYIDE